MPRSSRRTVKNADAAGANEAAPARGDLLEAARAHDVAAARSRRRCGILSAHTVETTEALRRLDAGDPEGAGAYLEAAPCYVVPRRRERNVTRIATVAREFLRTYGRRWSVAPGTSLT